MQTAWRAFAAGVLLIGGGFAVGAPRASAQSIDSRSSLGGYGATSNNPIGGMGGGSGAVIPFAGSFGGFTPYRMGGDSSPSFSARGTSAMESARTFFRLSPTTGGMSLMSGGIGQGLGASPRTLSSFGLQGGMGLTGGMQQRPQRPDSISVTPPSFGYPFYQPPSPLTPSSSSVGMSM